MYGRISEHQFYSFPPKPATQTRHRIGEAALGAAGLNQQPGQHLPQTGQIPSRIRQKTMMVLIRVRFTR